MLEQLDQLIDNLLNVSKYYRNTDEKTSAINMASMELFKKYAGPVGEYSTGRPIARTNFQETSLNNSLLSTFYRVFSMENQGIVPGSSVPAWGFSSNNLARLYDVKLIEVIYDVAPNNRVAVKCLPDNQVKQRLSSKIVAPTSQVPIGEYLPSNQYAIYPEIPTTVEAKVLIMPDACKLVYLPGTETYDPVNSIDLNWTEDAVYTLAIMSMKYLGLNIPNQNVLQAAGILQEKLL
jgi:hypothetical protein